MPRSACEPAVGAVIAQQPKQLEAALASERIPSAAPGHKVMQIAMKLKRRCSMAIWGRRFRARLGLYDTPGELLSG
jgi:hypothetical protein